ncbi:HNH endonuclease signature motif containing protein [Sphingomonas aerolata]|uniref:HNH endonuclease n=1 Tax=Sphingomonas aerolata TaxID=185951 RepID=UPI003353B25D
MHWPFVVHQTYVRRTEIHALFGGQQQGGISTPRAAPGIFIFTGHGAGLVGYKDRYETDGSFRYTGQGQVGDMRMVSGNSAIRDHAADGKDLLIFSQEKRGGLVRFEGLFSCAGWEVERQDGMDGLERDAIVFHLVPLRELEIEAGDVTEAPAPAASLPQLRKRALAAAAPASGKQMSPAATVFVRSRDVRDYVLARADGVCEACDEAAPFMTANGRPYLEVHHIRRLSDGGPDDPRHVGGICPNCHRRAHYGEDRGALNVALQLNVDAAEAAQEASSVGS